MGYTSESAMDERGLRDVERWKDKIEVRLDNRQVFFLFFGSALVACLLFVLGVMVGKRLESRGRAVAPEVEDPLTLLDRVARVPAAIGSDKIAKSAPVTPPAPVAPPAVASAPRAPVVAPPAVASAPRVPVVAPPAVASAPPAVTSAPKSPPAPQPTPAVLPTAAIAPSADATAGAVDPAGKGKGRFALQLGSYPDRQEAETLARRFARQDAYVVPSEIPGKGLWYRVRVGDFASAKEAIAAKAAFEKNHSVIAYVVGPR